LLRVGFQEGADGKGGHVLEIDPRAFSSAQANGQMAKRLALLKNAQVDLQRYQALLAQDSIAKQLVDTGIANPSVPDVQADRSPGRQCGLRLLTRGSPRLFRTAPACAVDPGNIVHASDANGLVLIAVQPAPWCSIWGQRPQ
jgi:multidrug efflux system membrane fusion protein